MFMEARPDRKALVVVRRRLAKGRQRVGRTTAQTDKSN